ncbi:hypothetical protein FE392_10525 [Xenorhabdus sp. 12]|uniref:Uncharacterized protein n=1 Tax=Xenorhabdus santafensis TaxID=2582833 RepID=A0ABU4SAF5_9GAMM|nr:hypothetical protein [Xenorhabdus sp. 12]MDX7987760.1 hypothetical protein [Xenorhabdus sp. 12]
MKNKEFYNGTNFEIQITLKEKEHSEVHIQEAPPYTFSSFNYQGDIFHLDYIEIFANTPNFLIRQTFTSKKNDSELDGFFYTYNNFLIFFDTLSYAMMLVPTKGEAGDKLPLKSAHKGEGE